MSKTETKVVEPKKIESVDLSKCVNLSAKIRLLASEGFSTGAIGKYLTEERGKLVRYQHVRNVLVTPVAKPAEQTPAA